MFITAKNRSYIKRKVVENPFCCVYPWAIQFVINTVQILPPGSSILEMGTFVGGTTRLFAEANSNITIHTIDIDGFGDTDLNPEFGSFNANPMVKTMQEKYGLSEISVEDLYEIRKMHIEDYPSIITHSGRSRDLDLKNIDLVFVDASHQQDEVISDLRYAWSILKDGGYIFGDDVQSSSIYNALRKFCQEVDTPYTIYSKCFKIIKESKGNITTRNLYENCFIDFNL